MKLLFALFLLCATKTFGQTFTQNDSAEFIVLRNQEEVGSLTITRTTEGKNKTYLLNSTVHIKALVNVHVHETIMSEYESLVLTSALHKREINGFNSDDKVVVKSGDSYVCDDETLHHLGSQIKSSVLMLYFHEPKNIDKVYSESFGEIVPVTRLSENIYSLKLPNQTTTDYFYENGVLVRVNAHTRWGRITFQRDTTMALK